MVLKIGNLHIVASPYIITFLLEKKAIYSFWTILYVLNKIDGKINWSSNMHTHRKIVFKGKMFLRQNVFETKFFWDKNSNFLGQICACWCLYQFTFFDSGLENFFYCILLCVKLFNAIQHITSSINYNVFQVKSQSALPKIIVHYIF